MVLLSLAIIVALFVTIIIPIGTGFWLNKKWKVAWRVIAYGALAYFIVQILLSFLFSGFVSLIEKHSVNFTDQSLKAIQLMLSVMLGAVLGVLVRWAGMKYIKEDLVNLKAAVGIGLGYGGIESLIGIGIPLVFTFITMLNNVDLEPTGASSTSDIGSQFVSLWQVQPFIPLIGSLERLAAMVMHVAVTILVLQSITRNKKVWLAAAFVLELLVNGLILGLAEVGLAYGWMALVTLVLIAGSVYLIKRLFVFDAHVSIQTKLD